MNKIYFILLFYIALNTIAAPSVTSKYIAVDQFGYPSISQKIAVIRDPQVGFDAAESFTPGSTYQLRNWNTDEVVFSATILAWNGGATGADAGDKAWWFDFSNFTTSGEYYVFDPTNNVGSYRFKIDNCVYKDVLKHAVRSFYYQRSGFPKRVQYAGIGYADSAAHIGPLQDKNCRIYNDLTNATTEKNIYGGWFDAGDYNRYVNFTWETLIDLLLAYEEKPLVWADDYNIPESGNGIPDLLDEVKWELEWLLRMQQTNGSVLSIVGVSHASPPSAGTGASKYGPASTSATLTASSVFALAAKVYRSLGVTSMTTFSNTLETASVNAWTWANNNPNVLFRNNDGTSPYFSAGLGAGQQETDDYGRLSRKLSAACFLYALNGNATYKTFFDANYNQIHLIAWPYAYPFEATHQQVLLYYTKIAGATSSVVTDIKNKYLSTVKTGADNYVAFSTPNKDPYMAYIKDYTWGSNSIKSKQGNMFYDLVTYNLEAANNTNFANAAQSYINYIHGVNPLQKVFLTNMAASGAENSTKEIYHTWFSDGSAKWDAVGTSTFGPAPGFLAGGPNPSYDWDGCCPSGCGSTGNNALCTSMSIAPPKGQPKQKSFLDFNSSWPLNSWQVTENGIYYQAAYIHLLSKFCDGNCSTPLSINELNNHGLENKEITNQVLVYPNPVEDNFNITYPADETLVSYTITDLTGKVLKARVVSNELGIMRLTIPNETISGVYLLHLKTNNRSYNTKFNHQVH